MESILKVENLSVYYYVKGKKLKAVNNITFGLRKGETLGIAGESGSGKSTIASAIMRILPDNAEIDPAGKIIYYGANEPLDITEMKEGDLYKFRWNEISMVFQGALNSLNPTIRIRDHFLDTARAHGIKDEKIILDKAKKLLELTRLEPRRVLRAYPHELSGGMKQRVLIALALLLDPKILILDEPTTALDVITQKHILDIIKDIKKELGLSIILITHDLGLIADLADRVLILYTGKKVEEGPIEDIYYSPAHPYTLGLIHSLPTLDVRSFRDLVTIPGTMPTLGNVPSGCPFHPRCPIAQKGLCDVEEPKLTEVNNGHLVACHFYLRTKQEGVKIYE